MQILMKYRTLILGWGLIFFVSGCATTDFKGAVLPSRAHAEAILQKGSTTEAFKGSGAELTATASVEYVLGEISSFWVTIKNPSAKNRINIDYRFSEFWLYTTDGERRALIIPEVYPFPSPREIPQKGSATLQVRLGRPKVLCEDIKMIECSFDLGKVRIFLLPNSGKRQKSFLTGLFY